MLTLRTTVIASLLFALSLALPAQTPIGYAISASPASLATIHSAKTLFLANGGANSVFANSTPGGANSSYNQLYAALGQWGRFTLVDSPANADLILTITSSAHDDYDGSTSTDDKGNTTTSGSYTHFASFHLSLSGPRMSSMLWQTDAPAGWSTKKNKRAFTLASSIQKLTDRIKLLAVTADSTSSP